MSFLIHSWRKLLPHRHHCMIRQSQSNPPWFKGLPPFCSYLPQADVSFILIPFFVSISLSLCSSSTLGEEWCKRFSPPDDVYFSIPSLRKFHPRTVWLEYKGTVQSQIRNRVKMSKRCCVVGRRCGSWEVLQKADRNVGGLRMKMKIREFVSGSPIFHIWEMIMCWMISRTEKFN